MSFFTRQLVRMVKQEKSGLTTYIARGEKERVSAIVSVLMEIAAYLPEMGGTRVATEETVEHFAGRLLKLHGWKQVA